MFSPLHPPFYMALPRQTIYHSSDMGRKKLDRTEAETLAARRATYRKSKAKSRSRMRHIAVDLPLDLGDRIDAALKQDDSLTLTALVEQSLSNQLDSLGY